MIFDLIRNITTYWKECNVNTTTFVFKLITKFTFNALCLFIFLITASQLFGNAIECFSSEKVYLQALTLKCWLDGVHLDKNLIGSKIGTEVLSPGVGSRRHKEEPELITFKFYQWIVPLLILQTFTIFIPRAIWDMQEKGTMNKLLQGVMSPVFDNNWDKQRKNLIDYITNVRKKYHRDYAMKYLFCEFLTILAVLFNMFTMNIVMNNFFKEYQPAVAAFFKADFTKFNQEAARVFPTQAKCSFSVFGSSGTVQDRDALCILPQNVINEKVFLILYVWYILILCCAVMNLIYLIFLYTFKTLRIKSIGLMVEKTVTIREMKDISDNGHVGKWFTLRIYRKNMMPIYFQDFCYHLKMELKNPTDEEDNEKYL